MNEQGLLEELLALRRDYCDDTTTNILIPPEMDTLFSDSWNFNFRSFDEFQYSLQAIDPLCHVDNSLEEPFEFQQQDLINYGINELYSQIPSYDEFSLPQATDSSTNSLDTRPWSVMEGDNNIQEPAAGSAMTDELHKLAVEAKVEPGRLTEQPIFRVGSSGLDRRGRREKKEGQPSKNLMAERRRRKRLNDRLVMLRSIVPKISKMDRTAILGDTIDYLKELLEKIKDLNEEMEGAGTDKSKMASNIFKGMRPNDLLLRNSQKFEVERRNMDTKVEICCTGKPGLLLSTVATLEALGLEIEQCVISCFNGFNMQASCSEESEQRTFMSCEHIKQALFRNAGYGGQCLYE